MADPVHAAPCDIQHEGAAVRPVACNGVPRDDCAPAWEGTIPDILNDLAVCIGHLESDVLLHPDLFKIVVGARGTIDWLYKAYEGQAEALAAVEAELERVSGPYPGRASWLDFRRQGFLDGIRTAREVTRDALDAALRFVQES